MRSQSCEKAAGQAVQKYTAVASQRLVRPSLSPCVLGAEWAPLLRRLVGYRSHLAMASPGPALAQWPVNGWAIHERLGHHCRAIAARIGGGATAEWPAGAPASACLAAKPAWARAACPARS